MPTVTPPSRSGNVLDTVAMGLSGLCLVHCLVLPAAIVALPALGTLATDHWVHQVLIGMAAPVSLWAVARSGLWRRPAIGLPVIAGLVLLAAAAFYPPVGAYEVPVSVAGALLLALAHFGNARMMRHRQRR